MSEPSTDKPVLIEASVVTAMLEDYKETPVVLNYVGSDKERIALRDLVLMAREREGGWLEVKPHVEG